MDDCANEQLGRGGQQVPHELGQPQAKHLPHRMQ